MYSKSYTITGKDMDINYHLLPVSAIGFFQDTVARFFTENFIAAFDVIHNGLYWVISDLKVDFLRPMPFWSEDVRIDIWCSERSKIKSIFSFNLVHREEIICTGYCCWILMNSVRKRPESTEPYAEIFAKITPPAQETHKKLVWEYPETATATLIHKINTGDLDFNHHTNNKTYISLATMMGQKYFGEKIPAEISTKFLQETFLDDELLCEEFVIDEWNSLYRITKSGAKIAEVNITWKQRGERAPIDKYNLAIRS